MKGKTFIKFFLVFLIAFTLIMIPVLKSVSDFNIFDTEQAGNLTEKLNIGVDANSPLYAEYTGADRINLLMLGVNQGMTDTIMLVSWNLGTNQVDIISVPRDTHYERDGYSGASLKINAIYSQEGLQPLAAAVSDVLCGIPIEYYAIIDYNAIRKVVDGIGGVPMDVPMDMHYEDPYDTPPLVIDLKAGEQILDGDKAIQFLRFRKGYPTGDYGRIEAQQEFMKSAFNQAIKHGIIDSARLVTSNVQSNLTLGMVSKYALNALQLQEDSVSSYICPGEAQYIDGLSFFLQDKEATEEMMRQIYAS
ncbi:MAG: LCP family protein [Firmicutes bacterium]|nr:LCP family protein [Bacillota bacterium]